MTEVAVPELSLVVLVGVSGSGKSTFAAEHFLPTEAVSSDACRALVADDPNDQAASADAFDLLRFIAGKRLAAGRLTVIDATNVQPESRRPLVALARAQHVLPVAIVLDVPLAACRERNAGRGDRAFGEHVLRRQRDQLRRSLSGLQREGFRRVHVLHGVEEVAAATVRRERLWTDRRSEHGPFDIIGDVHGCREELVALLGELGYRVGPGGDDAEHPDGRRAVFLGDLVDRGPDSTGVLRLVMGMVEHGHAVCVPGNHEEKLGRALSGRKVTTSHGLAETLAQLAQEPPAFTERVRGFLDRLVSHAVLDGGELVVAHAGLAEHLQGRASAAVRAFALYGDTTGETDEYGLPVRYPWAQDYRGAATVVYGHTPVPEPRWLNRTLCIDTGCVFGGHLTALRWPERELVAVPAARTYYEPVRPLAHPAPAAVAAREHVPLDLTDVLGKRIVTTALAGAVTVREEQAAAALEVMSRFAVDPRWLVHLPPTMAPPATSARDGLLEHPAEAFAAYRAEGVTALVCEEKHMGSRAVVVVCRDEGVARGRFGVEDAPAAGAVVTRTGRPFFADAGTERAVLDRVRAGIGAAGLWEELATDWLVLDAELLPWSAKAEGLLREQFAPVGASGAATLRAEVAALEGAEKAGVEAAGLLEDRRARVAAVEGFIAAYRRYCWPVATVADLRLAPFQLLAGEGRVHALRGHDWHLGVIERLCAADPAIFQPTAFRLVDLDEPGVEEAATAWWEERTAAGGEGMVVKPLQVAVRGRRGLVQPGLKVRGREYLRIVYGPEYTLPDNLARLRDRGLGHKRALAVREFALGIEALERFVGAEPLHRVHECVFAVLALESEPVDPTL